MLKVFLIVLLLLIKQEVISESNVFRFEPIVLIEEPPIGTLVLDLAQKLDIKDLATSDYKFRFYSPQSLTAHYFLIDQLTGQVKTQRTLDREFLCETKACGPCTHQNNCSLPIEIVATQTQNGFSNIGNNKHQNNKHQLTAQKFVSFDVIIEDKNEFAPKFPHDMIVLNVSEGAPPSFSIPLEPAIDRDSRQTQIIYSIEPVVDENSLTYEQELKKLNTKLKLMIDQSATGQTQLSLVILEPFDYELEKEIKLKLLASDGNSNKNSNKVLTGSCLVILKIIDINDNLPVFDSNQYEYRLDEDKAVAGTRLIRVHATDKDDGLNGLVKYYLVDQTQQQQQQSIQNLQYTKNRETDLFEIDELSGWISVSKKNNLDYEQMSTYRLIVKAQDSGLANSMPVYTNCIIYLNDINDNKPEINITLPSSIDDFNTNLSLNYKNQIELSEWTMPNTFIAQVLVNDKDSGLNGKVKLELKEFRIKTRLESEYENEDDEADYEEEQETNLEESNDFNLIHLFNNIYSIMLKQSLDREVFDKYILNITATDFGQPTPLKSSLKLTIKILDENDNKPVFVPVSNNSLLDPTLNKVIAYEFNITELETSNKDDWLPIGQVKAVDYDLDKNSIIVYEIENTQDFIKIDNSSGLFYMKSSKLDRELKEHYEFNLTARDNLNKETIKLLINLIDINDNQPRFEKNVYKFQLYENYFNKEKHLGRLRAHDLDKPNSSYSQIRFKLLDRNDYFDVNPRTGELVQLNEADYEQIQRIEFRVLAYDNLNKTPSLNSSCLVQVEIIDLNDNQPSLVYPQDSNLPLVYSIDSLLNDSNLSQFNFDLNKALVKLIKLNLTDQDSGLNSKLNFKLEKQIRLKQDEKASMQEDEELDLFGVEAKTGLLYAKIGFNFKKTKRSVMIGSYRLNGSNKILSKIDYESKSVGVYGLVLNVSDSNELSPLSTRVYLFLALISSNDTLTTQITMLKSILNETRLNSIVSDDYEYEYDLDLNKKLDQDYKFNRVLALFKKSSTNLNKLNKKLQTNSVQKLNKNLSFVDKLLDSMNLNLNNSQSKIYLLIFLFSILLFLTILIACLCLFSIYYRKLREKKNLINNTNKNNFENLYSNNFDLNHSKKISLNTTTTTTHTKSSSSSASPSSLTSSEILNSNRNSTDDDEDDSGGFKNLNHKTLRSSKAQHKDSIREEERAILIVNTSSATSTNNLGSSSSSSNKTNQLLVLVSSSSSSTSSPNEKKLASTESLTSTTTTTTSQQKNNFKTFKNSNSNTSSPKQTVVLTNEYSNSYKTLPINNHKNSNFISNNNNNNNNKQLNLPVNELFKRYELKKQANNNGIITTSSGSLNSINSLTLSKKLSQANKLKADLNGLASPKIEQRSFNLNPIVNIANSNDQNEIPDYFFKDEKEHKKFQNSFSKNKQILNLKKVIVDSTTAIGSKTDL